MNQKSNIWFELTHFKSSVTHYLAKYWVTLDLKWVIRGRRGTLVVVALAWESTAFRPSNRKIFRAALQYTAPPCPVRTHSALQRACWPYSMTAACNAKLEAFFLSMLRARISHRSENCNGDSWLSGQRWDQRCKPAWEMSHGNWDIEISGGGGCKLVEVSFVRWGELLRKAPLVWWCKSIYREVRFLHGLENIECAEVGRCNSWVFWNLLSL